MMQSIIKALLFTVALLVVVATPASAQAPSPRAPAAAAAATDEFPAARHKAADVRKQSPFASRSAGSQPSITSGPFGRFYAWLMATQQKVHRALATAVKDLKTGNPLWAALVLGAISFGYGVLHAAGPGHGKAVISSYVLANERTVKRGIALSFLAAAIQGLSALVLVAILVLVLRATSLDIKATEGWVETLSWGLVTLIGIWLLYTQVKAVIAGWQQHRTAGTGAAHTDTHTHAHTNHHRHAHAHHHHAREIRHGDQADPLQACPIDHNTIAHHQHHGEDCGCGHAHMPAADQLNGAWSWTSALAVAFSVGIRPCTGAIIVLVFAISQGLMWAGVFATFAMALGTAITVSALAALAVGSRELATRMAGEDSRWGWRIERAAGLGGAALVTALGATFFMGSLQPAVPF